MLNPKELKESNIVQFPNSAVISKNPIHVMENIVDMKLQATHDAMDFIVPNLLESLQIAGIKISNEVKFSLLISLLESIMLEHFNLACELDNFIEIFDEEFREVLGIEEPESEELAEE